MSEDLSQSTDTPQQGKGRPTPKRKDQVAARKRPLVPADRKQAKKDAKKKAAAARAKARQKVAEGDERYLPVRDQGKQKKIARDIVDSRFNIGEIMMPLSVVFMLLATLFIKNLAVSQTILSILWIFMVATAIDSFVVARKVKKQLVDQFGEAEKGTGLYAAGRALQMRRIRLPKPQVSRTSAVKNNTKES
ncbi:MAG: DUF3043 domain-containing protein [Micrococcaceae bacterium]